MIGSDDIIDNSVRSKDVPYVDVMSEAVNNPLRMLAGWFIVGSESVAPGSLLLSYWMVGCYFMAVKRLAEYRMIGCATTAGGYRKSFRFYDEPRLLISIVFYASAAMLFFGAFVMRYKLELILAFPLAGTLVGAVRGLSNGLADPKSGFIFAATGVLAAPLGVDQQVVQVQRRGGRRLGRDRTDHPRQHVPVLRGGRLQLLPVDRVPRPQRRRRVDASHRAQVAVREAVLHHPAVAARERRIAEGRLAVELADGVADRLLLVRFQSKLRRGPACLQGRHDASQQGQLLLVHSTPPLGLSLVNDGPGPVSLDPPTR